MYIIVCSDIASHCETTALGHEIHMSRYVLCQLLHHNCISESDTIVTRTEDRCILYTKLFTNVITHNVFKKLQINPDEIVDLTEFMQTDYINRPVSEETLAFFSKKLTFDFKEFLYGNNAADVRYLLNNIDYPSITNIDLIRKKFIIIHMRIVNSSNHVWEGKQSCQQLINSLQDIDSSIICYTSYPVEKLDSPKKQITYISDFSLYCALMNHDLCQVVISEISGGGEISQYCHNKTILLYTGAYNFGEPFLTKQMREIRPRLHVRWQGNEGSTNAILYKFPSLGELIKYNNLNAIVK